MHTCDYQCKHFQALICYMDSCKDACRDSCRDSCRDACKDIQVGPTKSGAHMDFALTLRRHTLVPPTAASVQGKHHPLQWNILPPCALPCVCMSVSTCVCRSKSHRRAGTGASLRREDSRKCSIHDIGGNQTRRQVECSERLQIAQSMQVGRHSPTKQTNTCLCVITNSAYVWRHRN